MQGFEIIQPQRHMTSMVHCKNASQAPADPDIPEVIHNPAEDAPALVMTSCRVDHTFLQESFKTPETLVYIGF